jgi:hypothetical protein
MDKPNLARSFRDGSRPVWRSTRRAGLPARHTDSRSGRGGVARATSSPVPMRALVARRKCGHGRRVACAPPPHGMTAGNRLTSRASEQSGTGTRRPKEAPRMSSLGRQRSSSRVSRRAPRCRRSREAGAPSPSIMARSPVRLAPPCAGRPNRCNGSSVGSCSLTTSAKSPRSARSQRRSDKSGARHRSIYSERVRQRSRRSSDANRRVIS